MYQIIDADTGTLIETALSPTWVKQQRLVDRPILARNLNEADGVVLSDGDTMRGIAGRGMDNYTPLVTVEEISSDPYVFAELDSVKRQLAEIHTYQTEETVLTAELDAAYVEGVNSVE